MTKPRLLDIHVHMVGNGGGGSGGWLRLSGWHRWLAGFMLRRNADRVRSESADGRSTVHFHFDH